MKALQITVCGDCPHHDSKAKSTWCKRANNWVDKTSAPPASCPLPDYPETRCYTTHQPEFVVPVTQTGGER